jgi:hypothetical protein
MPAPTSEAALIRLFCFCLATYLSAFVPVEGRNSALAAPAQLAVGPTRSLGLMEDVKYRRPYSQRAYQYLPRYHYYGAERPDGYYGYGYYQPYRPYAY